jgi:hypothetical protein
MLCCSLGLPDLSKMLSWSIPNITLNEKKLSSIPDSKTVGWENSNSQIRGITRQEMLLWCSPRWARMLINDADCLRSVAAVESELLIEMKWNTYWAIVFRLNVWWFNRFVFNVQVLKPVDSFLV